MTTSRSLKLALSKEPELKARLQKEGFELKSAEYAFWRAQNDGTTITFYKSGKLLVQGKGAESFSISGEELKTSKNGLPASQSNTKSGIKHQSWIGTDESGKGDYFGPLVIAGVLVDKDNIAKLSSLGIQDSKCLKDSAISKIAPEIRKLATVAVITINPPKYNELYKKIGNLNNLLAWGHARAIENILEKKPCQNALSDKFGNESLIKNALLKNGRNINLEQRTKAEDDIAVAAASILARDEFVRRMKRMGFEYGMVFPKGGSANVTEQGRKFVEKYGFEKLSNVAKLHFKTTEKVK